MALPKAPGSPVRRLPRVRALAAAFALVFLALAGCSNPFADPEPVIGYTDLPGYVADPTGKNATAWPDLDGVTLTIVDHGAFSSFNDTAKQFEELTGIKVKEEAASDTQEAVKKLKGSKASGKYDIIYGIDNMIHFSAVEDKLLDAYKPRLADRIDPALIFFPSADGTKWFATPVDHGYIGINSDSFRDEARKAMVGKGEIDSLGKVQLYADQFVTENPNTSTPGLGFLLITISQYGENPSYAPNAGYDWKAYWRSLYAGADRDGDKKAEGCVLVAQSWTEAYVQHFSAGYGAAAGGLADKPIVVSYSESPAYEAFYGMHPDDTAFPLVQNGTTYHQIQTMAIANGTKNMQAAQAWIEFTLTDAFQELAAPGNAVYPAVPSEAALASVEETYGDLDPPVGSFKSVEMSQTYLSANLKRWLAEWSVINQEANCGSG